MSLCLIDTHAHLADPQLLGEADAIVARAEAQGVERILAVGTDVGSSRACVSLAERFATVYAAVGIHPHEATSVDERSLDQLQLLAAHPKVVAIGETGLDYFRANAPAEVQRAAFASQVALAASLGLPIVVHNRSADDDVIAILDVARSPDLADRAGVLHCFTGGEALARQARQQGMRVSFAGNLTYRRSADLRSVAANIPLDWLLTETDSPYLSPEPLRGRPNAPSNVEFVVKTLADARGLGVEVVAQHVRENARELFGWSLS